MLPHRSDAAAWRAVRTQPDLSVIESGAVVERRHSVGTMRALGYTRRIIGTALLIEPLFTAALSLALGGALGLAIGGALGLRLSKNLLDANFFEQYRTDLTFAIPWSNLVVIAGSALLATLVATLLTAWQAIRVSPAAALRSGY